MRNLTLCLLGLVLAAGAPLGAETDPCEPDCPQTPFGALQDFIVTLPDGCQLHVTYATRLACGVWQDLYIESVRTVPTPPSPACQVYQAMPTKDLLWLVTRQMAQENPMGFIKPEPGCATDWRVVKGACWAQVLDPLSGALSSEACAGSVCCLEAYEVCFDDCGDVTCFEPQSTYEFGLIQCQPNPFEPQLCAPVCGNPTGSQGGSCP